MPRTARRYHPFQYYQVFNRGINLENIFRSREDYLRFLEKLAEFRQRFDWIIYSYCLLPDHYHLQIKARNDRLSDIIQALQTSHGVYFNKRYRHFGAVFINRFKSILVQKDTYFLQLSKYIHLNPVKAGLAKKPLDYPYSSYSEYFNQPNHEYQIIDRRVMKTILGFNSKKDLENYRVLVEEDEKLTYDPAFATREIIGSKRFVKQFETKHQRFV